MYWLVRYTVITVMLLRTPKSRCLDCEYIIVDDVDRTERQLRQGVLSIKLC